MNAKKKNATAANATEGKAAEPTDFTGLSQDVRSQTIWLRRTLRAVAGALYPQKKPEYFLMLQLCIKR